MRRRCGVWKPKKPETKCLLAVRFGMNVNIQVLKVILIGALALAHKATFR
jgi:hypothetical protein